MVKAPVLTLPVKRAVPPLIVRLPGATALAMALLSVPLLTVMAPVPL